MVFPHTTPDGRLVNLYGRTVGTAAQVPKAKRHAHLPRAQGDCNAAALGQGITEYARDKKASTELQALLTLLYI